MLKQVWNSPAGNELDSKSVCSSKIRMNGESVSQQESKLRNPCASATSENLAKHILLKDETVVMS